MTSKAQTSGGRRDGRHGRGVFRGALLGGLACAAIGALSTSAAMATDSPQNCTKPAPDATPQAGAKCLGFGLGIGGFFFTEPDIVSTTIDGGAVRVLEQHQREAALWLEIHNTFFSFSNFTDINGLKDISVGPFAALQMGGTNGTFSSFAVGGMIYFPTSTSVSGTTNTDLVTGFGLGVGYGWTQVHRLGDGIVEDQPLPAGISTVRLKQADIGGLVIMLSTNIPLGN